MGASQLVELCVGELDDVAIAPRLQHGLVVIEVADSGVEVRLADDRGVIAGVAELGDVARKRARARHALVVVESMHAHGLTAEQADPRRPTQRGVGDAGLEPDGLGRERVEMGRGDVRVPGRADRVGA